MKSNENRRIIRNSKSIQLNKEGPNWILLAGGALISTLILKLGFRLNRIFHHENSNENNCPIQEKTKSCICQQHSKLFCSSDLETTMSNERDISLPLVKFNDSKVNADITWSTSTRHFQPSISSESLSESGSDIYIKREVIQKLRLQLQRRDEMILEMHIQISDLKNSLNIQIINASELESQVGGLNRELFDSEREIQRLRKVIADHCVRNGDEINEISEAKMEMMKKEIEELRVVIEGKDFFIRNYKEQKKLCEKVKELQVKLDVRVPNML
ncbi:hypothetical protein LUZ60_014166 [Juncus effusus]|nr:hypothetical protein LUZ60_014166 [Juncus effusus]